MIVTGLIPASAGRTGWWRATATHQTAHPRECGADLDKIEGTDAAAGSSPRVRGGQNRTIHRRVQTGLIPASAGRTSAATAFMLSPRAHPRECGADGEVVPHLFVVAGSSPRVRGGQVFAIASANNGRLIPASAGRTVRVRSSPLRARAHPRECGADPACRWRSRSVHGSSPRVRGGRSAGTATRIRQGLIPASAGRTFGRHSDSYSPGAHPRECGADTCGAGSCAISWGSSPRVRGGRYSPRRG